EEAAPREFVPWRLLLGTAGGLVATAAGAIAAVTGANPRYLHPRAGGKILGEDEDDSAPTPLFRAREGAVPQTHATPPAAPAPRRGGPPRDARHYPDAVVSYRQALALSPASADLQNDLGVALQHAGNIDEAIVAYEAAIGIDAAYGRAHDNLGLALESRKDYDGAEQHYRLATGDRRVAADAHRYLGNLLEPPGQLQEARRPWRATRTAAPPQHAAQPLRRRSDEADRAPSQPRPASAS